MNAHDHLFHEIVLIEQGSGVHLTAVGRASVRPGDVLVLRPQVWHAYEKTTDLKIINFLVDSRLIARFSSLLAQVPGSFDLYRRRAKQTQHETHAHMHARPTLAKQITDRFNLIMHELEHQNPGWRAAAALGAMDVLVTCARLANAQQQTATSEAARNRTGPTHKTQAAEPQSAKNMDAPSRARQAVQDAVTIIESQYQQNITLDQLAQRVHLSPGHLSRSFNRYMGMSVVSFTHRLRAEEACRLLIATHQSITDIALNVGYDEVAYFSRCFKQQLGISPKEYRNAGRHEQR